MVSKDKQSKTATDVNLSVEKSGENSKELFSSSFSDEIATLLKLLEERDVTEFSLERDSTKISLKRGTGGNNGNANYSTYNYPPPNNYNPYNGGYNGGNGNHQSQNNGNVAESNNNGQVANVVSTETSTPVVIAKNKTFKEITSPMVGTFYKRPAVDAEPYVKVGDIVKKGDVLCIVEAMKLMNEIESEVAGKIVEICLDDTQMVEFGEVLFRIEPTN